MTTPERKAIVERFRARNPGDAWIFNEDALEESAVVIDPFRGFLRRGRSAHRPVATRAAMPEDAAKAARAFVERNADLLGLPNAVVHGLAEERSAAGGHWSIRFDATYPTKGYETLRELDNQVDLDVLVADDGTVTAFQNRSRIHPPLHIPLRPRLAPDDATLVRDVVGRQVFAMVGGAGQEDPRALPRIALGAIRLEDVQHVELTVWSAPGPAQAYVSYRLAYTVDVTRGIRSGFLDPFFKPAGYAFRYIVDADTGQVIEDARPPVMAPAEEMP